MQQQSGLHKDWVVNNQSEEPVQHEESQDSSSKLQNSPNMKQKIKNANNKKTMLKLTSMNESATKKRRAFDYEENDEDENH